MSLEDALVAPLLLPLGMLQRRWLVGHPGGGRAGRGGGGRGFSTCGRAVRQGVWGRVRIVFGVLDLDCTIPFH